MDNPSPCELVRRILQALDPQASAPARDPRAWRQLLADVLTSRPAHSVSTEVADMIDRLLTLEGVTMPRTVAAGLPAISAQGVGSRLSLWQGDITTLQIDAIVNAANNQLLGCFVPGHHCIDNAIHAAAGPRLRDACADYMSTRDTPEPTGRAVLTPAFNLPSRYVLHTVGPIIGPAGPTERDAGLLASCYQSCLDVAVDHGARSVAFCSISTGVFGYPIELATTVAVRTVTGWLTAHPETPMKVVFNTFSATDTDVYRSALSRLTSSGSLGRQK